MRRYLALSAAVIAFVMLSGSACNDKNKCSDDSEAISTSLKPTCKPEPNIKWVDPNPTVKS